MLHNLSYELLEKIYIYLDYESLIQAYIVTPHMKNNDLLKQKFYENVVDKGFERVFFNYIPKNILYDHSIQCIDNNTHIIYGSADDYCSITVNPDNIPNGKKIMWGRDMYNRFFISFLFKRTKDSDIIKKERIVFTIYQRYTNECIYANEGYMFGTHSAGNYVRLDNQYFGSPIDIQWEICFETVKKKKYEYLRPASVYFNCPEEFYEFTF